MEQGISYREARDMGFKTSKRLWKVSLLNRPDLKRGRKPLSTVLIGSLNKHIESMSNFAANRTVKSQYLTKDKEKEDLPVINRTATLHSLYESFQHNHKLSFSSFNKYKSKRLKKPHRQSDVCEYCSVGKSLEKTLVEKAEIYSFESFWNDEFFDAKGFSFFLNSNRLPERYIYK